MTINGKSFSLYPLITKYRRIRAFMHACLPQKKPQSTVAEIKSNKIKLCLRGNPAFNAA